MYIAHSVRISLSGQSSAQVPAWNMSTHFKCVYEWLRARKGKAKNSQKARIVYKHLVKQSF